MGDPSARDAEIFAEALCLPAGEREAYVARVCGPDEAFRHRIMELLNVQNRVGDFLDTPNRESGFSIAAAVAEGEHGRVGRYRLIEKLGEGGCGVVYLAEQDEPVRRQVALKIIKPGMDTKAVIARFEAERQALAMMDHPGIAKVFDAGQTESGRPYFVMELIRGMKITDYCDQQALPTHERLKLFVGVCQAIQHAHQKGVIHRDIKPSNILIMTSSDGTAQPVVIDFGIAKATIGVHLTDKTLFTAVDMLIGTPTYMSPEQTAVSSADVDTRSDIYSLGVLLYELLTGTTPFDAGELLQLGIDEVCHAIREREPLRPSARLARTAREQLWPLALRHRTEPPTLIRTVRGDLDWIAMKAIEKDRARRYETANGLALDVTRFLANETVSARPASTAYRFRKTVARNRLLFGSLTVVLAILVASLVFVSLTLRRERHARAEADAARKQAEADRARALADSTSNRQVTRFLQDLMRGVGPVASRGRDTAVLQEILQMTAVRVDKELADQPLIRAELQSAIARVYREARIWGHSIWLYRQVLDGFRRSLGSESLPVATTLSELGSALLANGQLTEAEAVYRESLGIRQRLLGPEHPDVAAVINELGRVTWYSGDRGAAERLFDEAMAMRRRLLPPDHADITDSLSMKGFVLASRDAGLAEAEAVQRDVLERLRKANGPAGVNVDAAAVALGNTLRRQARLTDAVATLREAESAGKTTYGEKHHIIADDLVGLGWALVDQGNFAAAESVFRETIAISPRFVVKGQQSPIYDALAGLGLLAEIGGDLAEAERLARMQLADAKARLGDEAPETAASIGRLAGVLLSAGRVDEADQLWADWATPGFMEGANGGAYLKFRANHRARRGQWAEAANDAAAALDRAPADVDGCHALAALLVAAGRSDDHRLLCQRLIDRFRDTTTAIVASRLAMDCLVLPTGEAESGVIERWVDTGVQGGMEGNWAAYAECAKALWACRTGRLAEAVEWAQRSGRSLRPDIRAMSAAVLSMAYLRQGDVAAARAALADGAGWLQAGPLSSAAWDLGAEWKEGIGADLGHEWKGGVLARALFAEASALLSADSSPVSTLPSR